MNKILLITLIVIVCVLFIYFVLIPFVITPLSLQFFWFGPLEKKQQDVENFQSLCKEWNTTGCSENPSDELCKAAVGKIATNYFPPNTKKCSDVTNSAIELLRQACCGE